MDKTYGKPSILHTTLASGRFHLSSHIEPQADVLLNLTNTVPLLRAFGSDIGGMRYTSISARTAANINCSQVTIECFFFLLLLFTSGISTEMHRKQSKETSLV